MSSFRTKTAQGLKPLVLPESGCIRSVAVDIDWPDAGANIASGDIVTLCDIPPGFQLVDFALVTDDIDTGTTAVATLGYLNAAGTAIATPLKTGINTFQAGGTFRSDVPMANLDTPSVERRLALAFTGAAAGSLAGKKAVAILELRTV